MIKVQMKCLFFIAELERPAKIRKNAIYRFLISLLVRELQRFKDQKVPEKVSDQKVPEKAVEINQNH